MDIQTPFIFLSLFSLASVLLIFIYKFGIKEKSYEEALAEQRQQTHILLGVKQKSTKDKKNKKTTKKGPITPKEKLITENHDEKVSELEQVEINQKAGELQKKPHVEFKEAVEDANVKSTVNKKQAKKDKVKPILINKETDSGKVINIEISNTPANQFEKLHPKDDYELLRSITNDDVVKEEPITQKQVAKIESKTVNKTESEKKKQLDAEVVPSVQKENEFSAIPPTVNGFIANTGKEKKKKKSEFNTIQQLAGTNNGPNVSVLIDLIRKAELSRSEVQILIDLLLNKQHEAPTVLDEWSEGKSDPVQKLKKQLAEKEKLLSEEQQVVASAQAKLREVRLEHQNEKALLQQKMRSLEEMIHTKQMEATRNQQQVQQLQAQIKEEQMKYHKLREENSTLQMQRQQFELRQGQAQESEVIISELQGKAQELSAISNQFRLELVRYNEENIAEKEKNQAYLVQLSNYQKELDQQNEKHRQLKDIQIKMEQDLEKLSKEEANSKTEISRLTGINQQKNEEIRRLEHTAKQFHDELQKHKDESNKVISQLTADLQKVQEENVQIKVSQKNGSLQERKQHEVEILNLHNELSSIRSQLSQTEEKSKNDVRTANAVAETLKQQIDDYKRRFEAEKVKLDEQKIKNDELRTKNWKVMEALSAAESKLKNNTKDVKIKSVEEIQREFVQRLFPELKDEKITDVEVFKTQGENFVKNYISNLKKQNVKDDTVCDEAQLKLQLQHYKKVIDNTEKILNQLQKHIEQEEINWRMQLATKTDELDIMKENLARKSQVLDSLAMELKKEQEDKMRIVIQLQQFQNAQNPSSNGLQ